MSTKGFTKKENQRRYALHRTIRKLGGVVSTKNRTIFIPIEQEELPPQIIELGKRFGYNIQTQLFTNL